jgi:hypothetical protein
MENEAQGWLIFSEELLQVVCHAKETNLENLLTGDESRFYCEDTLDSTWAPSRATLPTRKAQKSQTKKCLVSIIWLMLGVPSFVACLLGCEMMQSFLRICCCV